jgi:RNA polymerase-interacting CarD/CdnL/TRCF family regulator
MTYQKGDHVRYGTNGVCVIADIETMTSMDRRSVKDYYVLRPVAESGTKIFVPLDNPALLGKMHAILTREEINEAIRQSAADPLPWVGDRNRRSEAFQEILKTAEPFPLLQLCSCIHGRRLQLIQEGKRLSGSDEAILKQAERLVENEFAFSLDIPRSEVAAYIHALWKESSEQ